MTDPTNDRILYALYCLSRDTRHISAQTLARAVDVTPTRAARALVALEAAGLVDASRARLTMLGLAKAVAAGADLSGRGLDLQAAVAAAPASAALPVAARPSEPPPRESWTPTRPPASRPGVRH